MKESLLLSHLRAQPFVLAPMAAITDRPFRSFMREMGCGIVTSELVSATGLKFSSAKTLKLMEFDESQHPVGIQLFGEDLEHLAEAARRVEQLGADFVDLNFGCPVPKVVKKGAGSACLKDLPYLREILRSVKSAVGIPVTMKVRTGWDDVSKNTFEVTRIAADEGISWVAIHGRTRAQAYNGLANWDYIREVKTASPVPVIGNGDLTSAALAVDRLRTSGCDAVMIGRGGLKNPFIFFEAYNLWSGVDKPVQRNYLAALNRLSRHLEAFYDEKRFLIQLKKFAVWYSAGFPGSAAFRSRVFQIPDRVSAVAAIEEYFGLVQSSLPADTSGEAFLMGGHG